MVNSSDQKYFFGLLFKFLLNLYCFDSILLLMYYVFLILSTSNLSFDAKISLVNFVHYAQKNDGF